MMGLSFWSSDVPTPVNEYTVITKVKEVPVNTVDICKFKIINTYESKSKCGTYVVARVNYESCSNYGGDKILVFEGILVRELMKLKRLDPHFLEKDNRFVPVARFIPTEEGFKEACRYVDFLVETDNEN